MLRADAPSLSPMIVADANIILSGVRSRNGASHVILRGMLTSGVPFALSPAVVLEYEDVLGRPEVTGEHPWLRDGQIESLLDALCARAVLTQPWFRFRPFLHDAKDDLYIECALAAGARWIITHDRHFQHPAVAAFGLEVRTAGEFVMQAGLHGRSG